MTVTMSDIARITGYSRYTVSKVLNGDPSVRPAIRQKILKACEKYNYLPNSSAVSLVRGRSNYVGVVIPYLTDDFYSEFIEQLDICARKYGYELIYKSSYNNAESEAEVIRTFLSFNVCAIICVPVVENSRTALHQLAAQRIPVVYFDRQLNDTSYFVGNDNYAGVYAMTQHLLKKGRTPAYLGSFYNACNRTAEERKNGYLAAMADAGKKSLLIDVSSSPVQQDNESFGYENMQAFLSEYQAPDALLCVTDTVALGAMRALREKGVKIGEDILIAGHDNLHFSRYLVSSLSSIRQTSELFSPRCLELVDCLLKQKDPGPVCNMFPPELIFRESTGDAQSSVMIIASGDPENK